MTSIGLGFAGFPRVLLWALAKCHRANSRSTMLASERLEWALLLRLVRRLPLFAAARTHDDACGQSLNKARGRKPRSGPTRREL
jgi:hypothetical protein